MITIRIIVCEAQPGCMQFSVDCNSEKDTKMESYVAYMMSEAIKLTMVEISKSLSGEMAVFDGPDAEAKRDALMRAVSNPRKEDN